MAAIRSLNSELFTIDATVTLVTAAQFADESGAHQLTPEHILLALLKRLKTRL